MSSSDDEAYEAQYSKKQYRKKKIDEEEIADKNDKLLNLVQYQQK